MIELIALIILICSLIGMGLMIYQKIPLLLELPETTIPPFSWRSLFSKMRSSVPAQRFSNYIILQKILSKIRVLTLKTDSKTFTLLQKLREKSKKNKFGKDDNYWQEIKKKIK